ncbi:Phytochelatin synthase-domain-containing protein [Geopyxis carbonaria]|nr:Phytochelatin synthase-domain-containing protein [Geopyxis carbonaria]
MATPSCCTNPGQAPATVPAAASEEQQETFYMRTLPSELLTAYDSPAGKALFTSALLSGSLESFFPLSQQFLTQSEPAYCGLGTLCMLLNALHIDPAVTWRTPWRWFTEAMLDCCRPLEWVRAKGITLAEFSCLARCNGLDAETRFADQSTEDEFTAAVKASAEGDGSFVALSYSRAALGQTGQGHFSPVGGYTEEQGGMVLVLDVARFKYPSYWVPVKALFAALRPADPETGQPRGYCIVRCPAVAQKTCMLTLNATIRTWPNLREPLRAALTSVSTYPELLTALGRILAEPSGLPCVAARYQDKQPWRTYPGRETIRDEPDLDHREVRATKQEYTERVQELYKHIRETSAVYQQLEEVDELWKVEITVFLVALLSSKELGGLVGEGLREQVAEGIRADLGDKRIANEVDGVRRQMEGLEVGARQMCGEGLCAGCP